MRALHQRGVYQDDQPPKISVAFSAEPQHRQRLRQPRKLGGFCNRRGVHRLFDEQRGSDTDQERAHDEVQQDGDDDLVRSGQPAQETGWPPSSAPQTKPLSRHSGTASQAGVPGGRCAPHSAIAIAPAASCPSPPTLNRPARCAKATDSPVRSRGRGLKQHLTDAVDAAPQVPTKNRR